MTRVIIGLLIGVILCLIFILSYKSFIAEHSETGKLYYSIEKKSVDPNELNELTEKINSLNSRITDFYIALGIIVTLILAIQIGIYIKTENDVQKHISDNFEAHRNRIENIVGEAESILTELRAEARLKTAAQVKMNQNIPEPEVNEQTND